jgi:hypothetical protein
VRRKAEFEELLAFLREAQLDRVGCFAYSAVDGAAANALPDPVPEEGEGRAPRTPDAGPGRDQRRAPARKGRENVSKSWSTRPGVGRSSADAPDIDGVVNFSGPGIQASANLSKSRSSARTSTISTGDWHEHTRSSGGIGTRTGIGDYGGSLKDFAPTKLGAIAIKEAVAAPGSTPRASGTW